MRVNWISLSTNKHHHIIVKLAVVVLLLGLAFRLFVAHYKGFASELESPVSEKVQVRAPYVEPPVLVGISENEDHIHLDVITEKCDLFKGDWIPNPSGPSYTNESCPWIENHQNCMKNGRPDFGYLYWKWKPHDCQLPRFNAERFLELMRSKTWALIGDSISRNHAQSLLCMLSTVCT
ncbi:hypothetical protein ERO13_A08G099910v2 [Gossypium hirsutum]|uniref:Uncharacterized protein n=4 Tax=Gossypium TaxID=3633 RepID=A0A5J5UQI7_GOSBA|nr:hypothetical protein ES319_A08G111200v1 [Gossypium barbadense]KAG4187468.1 hypothetical protein ERO13_A08G099910v2 [Gossypium hirsutum]TYH05986.1 hypothetical protein ES288_A08G122200v1 [Gossypium darwinii]TYI14458.1 hypothetical protein ES332_A08G121600v1 [Gossypium tomentosum]TYJ22326.1 hypothetical protein E1A91_A08G117700v1 [Gossypium mustelinum]